jgi:hypothetical protein
MNYSFSFKICPFNSNYEPDTKSRLTTNFANITKNPLGRKQRLESILKEMDKQLNILHGTTSKLFFS